MDYEIYLKVHITHAIIINILINLLKCYEKYRKILKNKFKICKMVRNMQKYSKMQKILCRFLRLNQGIEIPISLGSL